MHVRRFVPHDGGLGVALLQLGSYHLSVLTSSTISNRAPLFLENPQTDTMASESRLYTFTQETKDHLRQFRLGTSRAKEPQAVICMYIICLH